MKELISKTLSYCGYEGEPTEELLTECFLDYVSCGSFVNLDVDEARDLIDEGEITLKMMCSNLMKVR